MPAICACFHRFSIRIRNARLHILIKLLALWTITFGLNCFGLCWNREAKFGAATIVQAIKMSKLHPLISALHYYIISRHIYKLPANMSSIHLLILPGEHFHTIKPICVVNLRYNLLIATGVLLNSEYCIKSPIRNVNVLSVNHQ